MNVPGFIARQFYVNGSLRNTDAGWELQAQNPMGDGTLVGVGKIRVDGREIPPETVTARRTGDTEPIRAAEISRMRPVSVFKGDRVTLAVEGDPLTSGEHRLEVELYELNLGRLSLAITDRVA
jgi:hypothetical protein